MKIIPFDNSFMLCEHWLNNAKNNILNKDILNLQISYSSDIENNFKIVRNFIKSVMNESQEEILEDSRNCFATKLYTIYFNFINQIDICYEDNRNIIFITTMIIPDFNKLIRPILCVSLENYSLDLNSKFKNNPLNKDFLNNLLNNINHSNLSSKTYEENSIYYKKVLPLFELMKNKEYKKIANLTYNFVFLEPNALIIHEILQDTEYFLNESYFEKLLLNDLEILVTKNVLLHRLSIILYRLFFYKTESISIIDKFFSGKLHFRQASNFYPNDLNFVNNDWNTSTILKAYDLKGFETDQITTAKEIIENQKNRYGNDFDREVIHEVTLLSYEKIDELICNDIRGYENGRNSSFS